MKRLIIALIMLMITISVGYAYYNHSLSAANSTYNAGGNITGRINKMPSGLTSTTSGLQKGDKVLMNVDNTYASDKLGWQLLSYQTYSDYGCTGKSSCSGNPTISSWLAMSDKPIAKTNSVDSISIFEKGSRGPWYVLDFNKTKIYPFLTDLSNKLKASTVDSQLIVYRNLFYVHEFYQKATEKNTNHYLDQFDAGVFSTPDLLGKSVFIPSYYEHYGRNELQFTNFPVQPVDLTFSEDYFYSNAYADTPISSSNSCDYYMYIAVHNTGTTGNAYVLKKNSVNTSYAVRPSIYLNVENAVFAVSRGTSSNVGKVHLTQLPSSYSSIYTETTEDKGNGKHVAMKLRMYNSALTAQLNDIKHLNGTSISKITKDQTVKLTAAANAGNDGAGGIYTLSVILLDENNNFAYYKPLESAKGSGIYEFDLTGIAAGKYKVAVVNEAYNEALTSPADSSLISNTMPLEIVEPVSVNATPKTGLEVGKNVNQNDVVATYTTSNGVSPITTTLVSDTSVSGHENDFQLFSLSNGNIVVKGPNGLAAGDYYFKLNAIDSNGDPTGGVNSSTVHISVAKTNLTVAFNDPNQTKKSITQATAGWSETATANPSAGTKSTYAKSGGSIGLINIDSNTGAISYTGGTAYGKVTIKATADDDPSSGYDNYNSADTTKEIVIYREVDGSVTPDSNSSDTTVPTFTTSDANVKPNGLIGKIIGTLGTPDNATSGTTTYKYGIKNIDDYNYFSVNPSNGEIKTTADLSTTTGSYNITVTVSDNWSTKEIPVTINVGVAAAEDLKFYENSTSNVVIATKSVKVTDTNVSVYATVKGSSNHNPVTYKIKDGSTNVIEVNPNSGAITIHGVGTVTIVAEKQGASGQADASAELTFTVTAGAQNFIYTDNAGNELPKSGNNYQAYQEVYAPSKTFQLYTAGNPTGTTVTYQLKAGSPTDVISVDGNGLVTILNASLNNQMGKVIVQATSHDPSGNYSDKIIELPINIEKGTRVISFAENPIYVTNGKGKVTPITEVDGATDTDGDVLIEVDSNEDHTIAWTNDNKNINYNYSGDTGKDIKIHATKPMDRNYKAAEADGTIHIMGPDENILAITSPGQIIYGDHFTIRSSQYDADSTNVQYTFTVDSTTYISNPTVNGNSAEFDALKFSGSNKTTITVTRTADGETPLSKNVQVTVFPKPIEIIIDDKEKLKGEQNPTLTYQDFRSELVSWNGVQDIIQENDIKLSTTAKTDSNAGSYPIKGDANSLNKTYPNYSFTFKEGTLTITEENVEDDWYHLEVDDGNNTVYTGNWTNKDVNIVSDHTEYINLSLDQSTWKPNQVTVSKEGETNQSFWMKKDSGAITKEKQEIIRIDKTAPKVKGIKAKDTNNTLQDIINKISGGIFFKPGTAFEITTDDSNADLKVSGTKEITYKVYKIESQARAGEELIKDGSLTVTNEKASITISELTGTYKVCVIPTDNAGNTNTESCHEVELKKIDVDVDDDGKPDFNDPDGDGCPDLNIKWKDPNNENKWIVINGDRNYDGIPDLNIDSDGDGKPDLNIDTDKDGKPDLNLVILKKGDWKPTKCVRIDTENVILEEYCTGTSVKALINVDTDNDGIPNINIDNNGNMKADINISKDGETAFINIAVIHDWQPNKNYTSNKFAYDSIGKDEIKPELNIDTDDDGRPDINLDMDGDGVPDLNVDIDGDNIPDMNIDSSGDGQPDINVDTDNDGKPDTNLKEITEWKPEHNADGEFPYDTMEINKTDDSKEPDKPQDPTQQGNNTDVKGSYYPGDNVGGAITGDETNFMMDLSLMFIGSIVMYLLYRYEKNTFQ